MRLRLLRLSLVFALASFGCAEQGSESGAAGGFAFDPPPPGYQLEGVADAPDPGDPLSIRVFASDDSESGIVDGLAIIVQEATDPSAIEILPGVTMDDALQDDPWSAVEVRGRPGAAVSADGMSIVAWTEKTELVLVGSRRDTADELLALVNEAPDFASPLDDRRSLVVETDLIAQGGMTMLGAGEGWRSVVYYSEQEPQEALVVGTMAASEAMVNYLTWSLGEALATDPTQASARTETLIGETDATLTFWRDGDRIASAVHIGAAAVDIAPLLESVRLFGADEWQSLVESAPPPRGYLGVQLETDGRPGAVVLTVLEDSPAGRANLHADDLITAIDDSPTSSSDDLISILSDLRAGDEVRLTVQRGDRELMVDVVLAERPE